MKESNGVKVNQKQFYRNNIAVWWFILSKIFVGERARLVFKAIKINKSKFKT